MRTQCDEWLLRLLILETDVERQDERVLHPLRHVRVASAVVHDEPTDELSVRCDTMLHLHDLNHVQVDRASVLVFGVWETVQKVCSPINDTRHLWKEQAGE
jgi:hypothetical protein